jgi:hypothetical protein
MRRRTPLVRGRAHASGAARRSLREVVWRGRPRAGDELSGVSQIQAIGLITGRRRPTTVGDYIEITAMKRTFVRVCPGGTPRPLRLYATQRMA